MKKQHTGKLMIGVITLVVAIGFFYAIYAPKAYAHEHRDVGDYAVVFGWQNEPAYSGVFNGPEITILDDATEEPIVGAEETLTLTVKFGPETKQLKLEPAYMAPGHYVAYMTPTRPGDYEFQLTGTLSETSALSETIVNETFSSADGEFSSIEPSSDVLFPDAKSDNISLQKQINDLKDEVAALKAEIAKLTEAAK
jgi:hypothetical protein